MDLVATGEIELGGIVVEVNEVWDREKERVEAFVLCASFASGMQQRYQGTDGALFCKLNKH